jgi:histone acetyltransferase (RNA polymerase elongator complex component)
MRRRSQVYPVFLPYAGCPFRCVYCDQHAVAALESHLPLFDQARRQMELLAEHVRNGGQPGEIAFYGGTFTALPHDLLGRLLDMASAYVTEALFTGIRFSTRPDCLDDRVRTLLTKYPVTTVELGIQSLSDTVLQEIRRGYSKQQALEACELVRQNHWNLGVQLMVGLPGDSQRGFLATVDETIDVHPDFVRLYPLLVFPGTELARWTACGQYQPLPVEEAVAWCVPAFDACSRSGIPIIRMGLLFSGSAEPGTRIVAGPWHPAFGQLVRSAWWRVRIDEAVEQAPYPRQNQCLTIRVEQRHVSDVLGWKRQNFQHWQSRWGLSQVRIERTDSDHADDLAIDLSEPSMGPRLLPAAVNGQRPVRRCTGRPDFSTTIE